MYHEMECLYSLEWNKLDDWKLGYCSRGTQLPGGFQTVENRNSVLLQILFIFCHVYNICEVFILLFLILIYQHF